MKPWLFAIMIGAAATPAAAQSVDDGFCRNGSFPKAQATFGFATVTGSGRLHFLEDMDGCPNAERRCRGSSYVVPGDRVVTGRSQGNYVCAYFPSRGGGTAGWVERVRLRSLRTDPAPPLSAWAGTWSDEGGNPTIRITARRGRLQGSGTAYWPGPPGSTDWPAGGVHQGAFEGELVRRGNRARHADDGCEIDFVLLGDMLLAGDNNSCGGMNVSFTGVYRRRGR
ncbi:MAG TPA: hypothetical protein VGB54_12055 [Allosphingosinicella sp.]|jgi:hypothetical protein